MYIDTIDMTEPDTETTVTYAIRDTSSGYVTPSTSALTNYYTKNAADGKYQLMLTAGEHIIINESNQISAVWNTATSVLNGLMSSTDKGNLDAAVSKLGSIDAGAEANKVNDVIVNGDSVVNLNTKEAILTIPTATSELTNDSGFLTSHTDIRTATNATQAGDSLIEQGVVKLITQTAYNKNSNKLATMADINASSANDGVLTLKINNVSQTTFSANSAIDVDFNVDLSNYVLSSDLATVATSGDYSDLINIPTIGSSVLTIRVNESSVGTFSANAVEDATVDITIPTQVSDLINDSDFIDSTYFTTIEGYDANETQILKHIQGTLTWETIPTSV